MILVFIFLCGKDKHENRRLLPWAFIIFSIANILLFTWIIIYIHAIYPRDRVWYPRYPRNDPDYDDDYDEYEHEEKHRQRYRDRENYKKDHYTESKPAYLIYETVGPFINGVCFIIFFFFAKDWVDSHANQERSHG